MKLPRMWPGFLAVYAAVILHSVWVLCLLVPGSGAPNATPVYTLYELTGQSAWRVSILLALVLVAAVAGLIKNVTAGEKILWLLPQQLVLGISAAGAMLAMYHGAFADGVIRAHTFIVADQLAVVLTWGFHTIALMFLWLIHTRVLTTGGWQVDVRK